MPADEYDKAQLAALIVRENDLEEALEEARQDVLLWVKRGRLAVKHDRQDLAREAKARAADAKQRFLSAQAELSAITGQKRRLRREARRPDDQQTFQAEMLVEQFKLQGFDPVEQETKEIAQRVEAGLELAALKGEPVAPVLPNPPTAPTAGPIATEPETAPPAGPEPPASPASPPDHEIDDELAQLKAVAGASDDLEDSDDDIAALERELAALRKEDAPPDQNG